MRELGAVLDVRTQALESWWQAVLGPPGTPLERTAAAQRLAVAVADADFVAPSFDGTLLTPLFVALRNEARLRARLLLVAHSPAVCPLEWALLGPLLADGDLLVAPSHQARAVVMALNPALAKHIVVVPHPLAPLDTGGNTAPSADTTAARVVSLGRIHPAKLLHRQIDALDEVRRRGLTPPLMEIAGAAEDDASRAYLRSLEQRVERLALRDRVRFVGVLRGHSAKRAFLENARALVNLSVTIEESFGKAPLEALGLGIPVIATRWNGLPETVGAGGVLVPVEHRRQGAAADVAPAEVAAALIEVLTAPPDGASCRAAAARCAPGVSVPRYLAALESAQARTRLDDFPSARRPTDPAAPEWGLLARTAPLDTLSWGEAFAAYLACCDDMRHEWHRPGQAPEPTLPEARLRGLLLSGLRWPIERLMATASDVQDAPAGRLPCASDGSPRRYVERLAQASQGTGWPSTRLACLSELGALGEAHALGAGIARLEAEGCDAQGLHVIKAEAAVAVQDFDSALRAASDGLDAHDDGEIAAFRLRQLARLARRAQVPERALAPLRAWLTHFPDMPDSGGVWLEYAFSALRAGQLDEAGRAQRAALALLGAAGPVLKLGTMVASAQAAAALMRSDDVS